jgi:hypothetical protein
LIPTTVPVFLVGTGTKFSQKECRGHICASKWEDYLQLLFLPSNFCIKDIACHTAIKDSSFIFLNCRGLSPNNVEYIYFLLLLIVGEREWGWSDMSSIEFEIRKNTEKIKL